MEWRTELEFDTDVHFSDGYKIRHYHYAGVHPVTERTPGAVLGFHAYFLPAGWANFGNNIRQDRGYFGSLEEAKAACECHRKKFGAQPNEHSRLNKGEY